MDRETLYNGYFRLDRIVRDGNEYEVFERGDATAALVYDTEKEKFVLVKQFRAGVEGDLTEIVAGSMDKEGEDPSDTIKREIREETGYEVDDLEYITDYYPSPGACSERTYVYYAEVSNKVEEGGGIGDEDIEIVYIDPETFKKANFEDGKTIIAQIWNEFNFNYGT